MGKYRMEAMTENCTGCMRCMLACSQAYTGVFNPLAACLMVVVAGEDCTVEFSKDCRGCGLCVDHCFYEALARHPEEVKMKIVSIAVSQTKGTRKTQVEEARVRKDHGLEGDAHAGDWHRQVSFLAAEKIQWAKEEQGLDVGFGDFAENIATTGVDWKTLPKGTRVRLGDEVLVEITQIGKKCHSKCEIFYAAGDCIMPREGVFARVLEEGTIKNGDAITIMT